jgi:hypothetical protein
VFQGACGAVPQSNSAAGGFAKAWSDHWKTEAKRSARKSERRLAVYQTEEYRRLRRKLSMANEHLLDAKGREVAFIKSRIAELEGQIRELEFDE